MIAFQERGNAQDLFGKLGVIPSMEEAEFKLSCCCEIKTCKTDPKS